MSAGLSAEGGCDDKEMLALDSWEAQRFHGVSVCYFTDEALLVIV